MMYLQINKDLDRASGGKIPAGSILAFTVAQIMNSESLAITWQLFYSVAALKTEKIPVPGIDIKAFQMKNDQQLKAITGCNYKPDENVLVGLSPVTFERAAAMIVKACMEERFLGENSCEIVTIQEDGNT